MFLLWISMGVIIVISYMFGCYAEKFARKYPRNYILLFMFTIAETYLVAVICSAHNSSTVM